MKTGNIKAISVIDRASLTVHTCRGGYGEAGAEKLRANVDLTEKLLNLFVPKVGYK